MRNGKEEGRRQWTLKRKGKRKEEDGKNVRSQWKRKKRKKITGNGRTSRKWRSQSRRRKVIKMGR